jgi:drug/metabolite transporter superfamily protein YnfA
MIEFNILVWFLAGIVTGCLHATMIQRSSIELTWWTPLLGMLRLAMVAAVLVLSAVSGQVLASAGGWAIGLTMLSLWIAAKRGTSASHDTLRER